MTVRVPCRGIGLVAGLLAACHQGQPPAAEQAPRSAVIVSEPSGEKSRLPGAKARPGNVAERVLGTLEDNLPFSPTEIGRAHV